MTDESDAAIIELVLGGQPDRFAAIVRRYRQALQRVAVSRLGRSDWAEDVVQETFFCAFKWPPLRVMRTVWPDAPCFRQFRDRT